MSPGNVFEVTQRLSKSRLVTTVRDAHNGYDKIGLNGRLYVYDSLRRLLLAMGRTRSQSTTELRGAQRQAARVPKEKLRLEEIYRGSVRLPILLLIAAAGPLDLTTTASLLGIQFVSAWYAVNAWERKSIIQSKRDGCHRVLELNRDLPVARELRRFLLDVVHHEPRYRRLGSLVRASRLVRG